MKARNTWCGPLARAAAALGLAVAGGCLAQAVGDAAAPPAPNAAASSPARPPQAAATGRIYQQRQKDGSILFTDRPPPDGTVIERSWAVPAEDAGAAAKRRERTRQEAREDAQAVSERVQRQIDRERDRETALALERMRLAQEQAQRDAEVARADRERAANPSGAPPLVVVVPGGARPPHPYPQQPPHGVPGGGARPAPSPARPAPMLCGAAKASDCNPSGDPARAGFGSR